MRLIRDLYHPTVAILPIGGHFTMGPREAALAATLIEPRSILPIHYGTVPQLTGTPLELANLVGADVEVVRWSPGETIVRE
jgi:L-ascorbate metabolism protein UlaG (beta-lactamase superfamily)